jgi:hypothetical protein
VTSCLSLDPHIAAGGGDAASTAGLETGATPGGYFTNKFLVRVSARARDRRVKILGMILGLIL